MKKMHWLISFFLVVMSSVITGGFDADAHEEMDRFKEKVRYTTHIQQIFERQCIACHGPDSPGHAKFSQNKKWYTAKKQGPRMDSYTLLISFIGWPDSGAVMRRLDDGKNTKDGKPGNMYQYLGETEEIRKNNLRLFKQWIGYWTLKRWPEITREEIDKMLLLY